MKRPCRSPKQRRKFILLSDLDKFRHHGGKMLHWHRTSDPLIFILNSEGWYGSYLNVTGAGNTSAIDVFYRYFRLGVTGYCAGAGLSADGIGQDDPRKLNEMKPKDTSCLR